MSTILAEIFIHEWKLTFDLLRTLSCIKAEMLLPQKLHAMNTCSGGIRSVFMKISNLARCIHRRQPSNKSRYLKYHQYQTVTYTGDGRAPLKYHDIIIPFYPRVAYGIIMCHTGRKRTYSNYTHCLYITSVIEELLQQWYTFFG